MLPFDWATKDSISCSFSLLPKLKSDKGKAVLFLIQSEQLNICLSGCIRNTVIFPFILSTSN